VIIEGLLTTFLELIIILVATNHNESY